MLTDLLVSFLLTWIDNNTSYDAKKFNIKIIQLSETKIQKLACKGKCPVIAFYKKNEAIYITKMNFENNLCNQSILIHEMIHFFQDDLKMENVFREKEAYEIQNKFLINESNENNSLEELNIKKCRRKKN